MRQVVCYGVGRFGGQGHGGLGEARRCRLQLALLLHLVHALAPSAASLCDPALSADERDVATSLGLAVWPDNDTGKRVLTGVPGSVLLFMPHCPLELYNHVLWAHWAPEALPRLLLAGNSFAHYRDSLTARQLASRAGFLARVHPVVTETPVLPGPDDPAGFAAAFNNLAVHAFATGLPAVADGDFWRRGPASDLPRGLELV